MIVCIPTRNNPVALAGLLSSLRASAMIDSGSERTQNHSNHDRLQVMICDSSDKPVLTEPHIARMLPMFALKYHHTDMPSSFFQRLKLSEMAMSDSVDNHVLFLDDDLILHPLPLSVLPATLSNLKADVLFGSKVDLWNDRKYPDFNRVTEKAGNNHAFCKDISQTALAEAPDTGIMYGRASTFREAMSETLRLTQDIGGEHAIQDEIFPALLMRSRRVFHASALAADHVGNSNAHWNENAQRRFTTSAILQRYEDQQIAKEEARIKKEEASSFARESAIMAGNVTGLKPVADIFEGDKLIKNLGMKGTWIAAAWIWAVCRGEVPLGMMSRRTHDYIVELLKMQARTATPSLLRKQWLSYLKTNKLEEKACSPVLKLKAAGRASSPSSSRATNSRSRKRS